MPRGGIVRVSLIQPHELGKSEIAVWHAMQEATPSLANPFLSPEFAMTVGRFRPGARVAILMEGQSITGFFPFERRRLNVGVPICGWLTPCQGVVHAPGTEWDPRQLLRGCHISAWRFDNLIVDQQPFTAYHSRIISSPLIDLSGGFEAYYEKVRMKSPRFYKELARRARKLKREFGELRVMADSTDINVLRTLLAWKSERYRQTSHVDRFKQPWLVELLETLLLTRTTQLSGLLSALYAGEQLVAAQFGLRTQSLLVGWFTGYETSFGKYSPGLLHIKGLAEEMASAGIHTIDMGGGAKNYYKETMKSYDSFVAQGVVTSRSVLGAAHHARNALTSTARSTVRQHPALHHAADQFLRRSGVAQRIYGRI
jgi:CelD/BcsL family acetyltransferase involved in cellulose biosynthesis